MLLRAYTSPPSNYRNRLLFAVLTLAIGFSLTSGMLSRPTGKLAPGASALSNFGNLPLAFEPNAGQTDPSAHFIAHASGSTLYFAQSEVVLALTTGDEHKPAAGDNKSVSDSHPVSTRNLKSTTGVRLQFVGANPAPVMQSGDAMPGKVNYLIGKDPTNWHTNLPTYRNITYSGLYPGVNLLYSGTEGQLKGTYNLAPGADPTAIRWRYAGANGVTLDDAGNLQITLRSTTTLTEHAPATWQELGGERVAVSSRYLLNPDGSIGFAIGKYDPSQPLTIDPTLTYSTYLGGFYGDGAGSVWLDGVGNIYIGGTTSSSDFPVAGNPFQPVYGGSDYDMFASKLSPDGSSLIYSTFVGGGDWDVGGLAGVDATGIATLGGWTASENFPTTPGAYQTEYAGTEDVAVAKLSADGSHLIFGSYWGDEGVDESYGFAVDGAGNTYFTGYWYPGRSSWAFVAALTSDGSQQLFYRGLGGNTPGPGDENANTSGEGIVVDGAGNIYVTGYTRAADFPVTAGAYRTSIQAYEDGFITKLAPGGQTLLYSTYIPGGVSDYPSDIAIDASGNAYITGNTSSADFPTTPGAFQRVKGDPRIAFVTKLNPSGSALVYSTFLGDTEFHFDPETYGLSIRVNGAGNAYVVGYTSSAGFPVANPLQPTMRGPYDGFVTRFNQSGSALDFSTFMGGSSGDSIGGLALDGLGHIYLAGSSSSTDFTMVNPLQPTNHGGGDAIVAVIAEDGAVTRTPTPTGTGTPPTATSTPNPCGGVTPWRTEMPMPIPHSYSVAAVHNNQLYVIGGASNSPTPVPHMQRFDPATNSWATLPPSPNGVAYMGAAAIGNKIYVMGSTYQPYEIFMQIYDIATSTWSRGATLPEPLGNGAFAEYGGKIYLFGGQYSLPSNHVYEYDPATNTYTAKAPMPTAQAEIGAATIGNRIYVVGGYQYIHYAYDPVGNSWTTIATPPTPTFSYPGVFALNGELWVEGGYDNWTRRGYPPNQEVQIYNPSTNSWRYGPAFNTPRYFSTSAGAINGRGYVVGGIDLNSNSYPYDYLSSMESITYLSCGTSTPTPVTTSTPTRTTQPTQTSPATTSTATRTTIATGTSTIQSTQTPASGTATSTLIATGTIAPTATPTTCPITFTDVPPGQPFYPYVHCLACRGVISGYNDGTFRPNNNVTRGQLTKIISNAAGFSGPQTTQLFQDVPPGSTFFDYISRLASRGYMTGYRCGEPEEECVGPGNLPYFRPYNNATRGQIAKIDAEAGGYSEVIPPTQQTFADVPPASTFWLYIERIALHGVIAGYLGDGVTVNPCTGLVEQTGLLYFRWCNNATRGQTAKIVANTFFPGCETPGKR